MTARMFTNNDVLSNNGFLNHWFKSRLSKNQNVIIAFTGPTGSGKTYDSMSCAESWYKFNFKEEYPSANICFSLGTLAKRIKDLKDSGKLRKGEVLILEEAGANFGNLDFQSKLSKMFSYILQSFRSMNLILFITLPVLTMVNKNARQLLHAHFITSGIDYENKEAKVKPYFHQLNQSSGKSYWKYPRVKVNGRIITLERLKFSLPTERLIKEYEELKEKFVFDLTTDFIEEAYKSDRENILKDSRNNLTDIESTCLKRYMEGIKMKDIAIELGCSRQNVGEALKRAKRKGYDVKQKVEFQKRKLGNIAIETHA